MNQWVWLVVAISLLFLWMAACTRSGDAPPTAWLDGWPVPPLPVMALKHPSGTVWGSPSTYCWHFESESERTCKETTFWSGIDSYPVAVPSRQIHIRIDAETRPHNVFGQIYTRQGNIMVDFIETNTEYPILDLDLDPGDYHIRVIGQWQHGDATNSENLYNEVSYEFGLNVPGEVMLRSECSNTLIGGDLVITLDSTDDPLRTAMDNANSMGCKFNKPIARVALTLDGVNGGTYIETFSIDPPSLSVGFPLPEDTASERSSENLPPGEYARRVVAVAEGGEEWDVTSHGDFHRTVTIGAP